VTLLNNKSTVLVQPETSSFKLDAYTIKLVLCYPR